MSFHINTTELSGVFANLVECGKVVVNTIVVYLSYLRTHTIEGIPFQSDSFGEGVGISGSKSIVAGTHNAYIIDVTSGVKDYTLPLTNTDDADISGNICVLSSTIGLVANTYTVDTGVLLQGITNPSTDSGNSFGARCCIDSGICAISAHTDTYTGTTEGAFYLFNATTGALLHTIDNPTTTLGTFFGRHLAISGNYCITGAQYENTSSGIAYIFNVSTGALVHTLNNPTSAAGDIFGASVSIDGNYAVVGAPQDNTAGTNSGAIYIFDVTTGALVNTIVNPVPAIDYFGISVDLDGTRCITGAPVVSPNYAHIHDVISGNLIHTFENPNIETTDTNDAFGRDIAIEGDNLIISAPSEDTSGVAYYYNQG